MLYSGHVLEVHCEPIFHKRKVKCKFYCTIKGVTWEAELGKSVMEGGLEQRGMLRGDPQRWAQGAWSIPCEVLGLP